MGKPIETDANAKTFWENLADIPTAPLTEATKALLRGVIGTGDVKGANFAATDRGSYVATATLTVTDPTPAEGMSFSVFVRNGTATVGGTTYAAAGTIILRVYHSGAWANYVYSDSPAARVTTITSSATPTVNTDLCDAVSITALAAAITSMTSGLTGTPRNFDMLLFRIKDNGTARAITWGTSFEAKGAALPTTTVLSKTLHALFIWDSVAAKWGCLSTSQEV